MNLDHEDIYYQELLAEETKIWMEKVKVHCHYFWFFIYFSIRRSVILQIKKKSSKTSMVKPVLSVYTQYPDMNTIWTTN
jgi:hypothetical protein